MATSTIQDTKMKAVVSHTFEAHETTEARVDFPWGYSHTNCFISGGMVYFDSHNEQSITDIVNVARVIFYDGKVLIAPKFDFDHDVEVKVVLERY